jgi:hypothetical protein
VLKRETEMESGRQTYASERQRLHEIETIMAPRRETLKGFGFSSDSQAINHILGWSDMLMHSPAEAIHHVAQGSPHLSREHAAQLGAYFMHRAGIDPRSLGQGGHSPQQLEQHVQARIQQAAEEARPHIAQYVQEQIRAALAQQQQQFAQRERAYRKMSAANASLNGYGTAQGGNVTPIRRTGTGQYGEMVDDVRAAVDALR